MTKRRTTNTIQPVRLSSSTASFLSVYMRLVQIWMHAGEIAWFSCTITRTSLNFPCNRKVCYRKSVCVCVRATTTYLPRWPSFTTCHHPPDKFTPWAKSVLALQGVEFPLATMFLLFNVRNAHTVGSFLACRERLGKRLLLCTF